MKIKLTDLSIKSLKPVTSPKPKPVDYVDSTREHGTGSLYVRVSPKGKKVFYLGYKPKGKKLQNHKLGTYPDTSLKDARANATNIIHDINTGNNPKRIAKEYKESPTMETLWSEYQKALARKTKSKAATTLRDEQLRWQNEIKPKIGDTKVIDITRADISKLLNDKADKSPTSANRMHSLLSIVFKVALDLGWIEIHPMYMMSKPGGKEKARKRFLDDDEIKTLWPNFNTAKCGQLGDIFKILLFTAQRSGEVKSMQWLDIENLDNTNRATWTLTDTKNDSVHVVPLSPQVVSILRSLQPEANQQMIGYVFPSPKTISHIKNLSKARLRLHKLSGVTGWTAHDLRRTARTLMSRLQIKQHIRERVLNHSQGGIVAVYDQYDYIEEKRDALAKLADEIDRITENADV